MVGIAVMSLASAPLAGLQVMNAPSALATSCPTGFTQVGSTDVCERSFTTTGTTTWTVPSGVSSIDVLVVGSGGKGAANTGSIGGGGGGGGGIAVITGYATTSADSFSITVGQSGGTGTTKDSEFARGGNYLIKGKGGRDASSSSGGAGEAGNLGSGVSGNTFFGSNGGSANSGTSGPGGTTVNQGLFQFDALEWSGGGGGGQSVNFGSQGQAWRWDRGANCGGGGGGGGGSSSGTSRGTSGKNGIVIIRTIPNSKELTLTTPTTAAANDAAFSSPPVVQVTELGTSTPVRGVVVTATIASSPGGSSSIQGSATATSDASGNATFSTLAIRGPTGSYTLTFSASGASSVTSSTITLSAGAATASQSVISAASATVGTEQTTVVTVQAKDSAGSSLTTGGDTVVLTPTAGSVGAITDNGDGTYTATYTAPSTTGSVTINGTLNGSAIGTSATITVKGSQSVSWSPTNTALTMPGSTITPSSFASTSGDGTITYAVQSAGTSGCTISSASSPFTLTYTAPGTCTVRASAAGTATYAAALADVDFVASLAAQSITASSTSTRLRPGQTATVSDSGSTGSGAITWTNTTPGTCTLVGTTVTADANGSCTLTVTIAADATYASASDSLTITITTPGGGGGGGGGSSGAGGSSGSSGTTATSGGGDSGEASDIAPESQDDVPVPGTSSTTRGGALPPAPEDVKVKPLRSGSRSAVLIRQPAGTVGTQVLATVVVVRDNSGKVISRINVALSKGQADVEVTVPFVADGYTVNVYNVNEVGVSRGALRTSPLVHATTITRRSASRMPTLFGSPLGKPIIFNAGSTWLDPKDRRLLDDIAQQAKTSSQRLFVTGFARKGGGKASELAALSTNRARTVATYLAKRGVRVWMRYWGAGSLNGTGKASDRRVEIRTSGRPIPRSLVP